ncbi:MAG: putative colanic acid biosynthesis UDP-glucose lipid carrier transferase [Flavobacteriales bacterium]|jgi:putative colanic acid biosynthesis UDP-glucose lipid carrier transferase
MPIQSSRRSKRLLQNHDTLIQWFQHILNVVIVLGFLITLTLWKDGVIGAHYRSMMVSSVLVMLITYHIFGVHRRFDSLVGGMQHLARAWGMVIIILAWVAFLTKTSELYSRQVIVYWAILAYFGQAIAQYLLFRCYKIYSLRYRERLPAIVVGTGSVAHHLAHSIAKNIWMRDKIEGVVKFPETEDSDWNSSTLPLLGSTEELLSIIEKFGAKRVYLAPTFNQNPLIKELQELLLDTNIDLVWAPDIFEFQLLNHSVREVAGVPLITINETPLMSGGPAFIKSLMDKSVSLGLIVAISPLLVGVAIAVKLTSKGPVLFKQVRDGWDGKKFHVYKFRSMYVHVPEKVIKQATKGDPRITPIGAFIRRTSLDELPQLFNILEGSMSLVGPRPHAESHNEFYSDKVIKYLARHRIKPGMTGLAQIKGFRGETETVEAMQGRVEYDLEYISNWSPLLDIKILFLTPAALFTKNDKAY